jgi:CRP-like cAMP-binding protein
VNQYITYKGFGENLRNRIIKYYQFKYARGKYFDENRILEELNQPLRQYIALRECQDLIVKVPFFKDADKYFITQVVMILKVNHYLPGDYIIEEGTSGDHMYFIASGTVEAIVNGVVRAKLSPGLFFGEIALLFGRMKRTASIRALSHCILYSLSRQDLNSVLELNPVMAERMRQVAADRLANDQKLKTQSTQLQAVIQKTAEDSPTSK